MKSFEVIKESASTGDGYYISYGIRCRYQDEILDIKDITEDKNKIEFIVNIFNKHNPHKVHIYDILENYLINFEDF
ncbi:MAG: hypothetical protein J1F17_04245 [Oscillospiraceae bacterium]|nr:hypothetical protein [Oscillospiraceae bacterium]